MLVKSFACFGYDDFFTLVSPELDAICTDFFKQENYLFETAILEAVCNAARYSIHGQKNAEIHFRVYIDELSLKVVVLSKTNNFNVKEYRQNLSSLCDDPEIGNLNWGEYTKDNEDGGRGLWLMLQACQYVIMNYTGQEITLISNRSIANNPTRKIKNLVPRFLIEEEGVIF